MVTKHRAALRSAWAVAAAAIVVGSLLPGSSPAAVALSQINDRLLHFSAYALLAFLPALHEDRLTTAAFALGSAVLGALLEVAQRYSPGRMFEAADLVSDAGGVICGLALGCAVLAPWRKR